jgi:signal transduction histidine kinase
MNHSAYFIYVVLFYGVVTSVHYGSKRIAAHIRNLAMIYSSSHSRTESGHQGAIRYAEDVLKKILDQREVWLCISAPGPHEQDQSWKHAYFTNGLKQTRLRASKSYIRMSSPIGESTPLYVRTLRDSEGDEYGWLLIQARKNHLSILQKIYIQLVLMKFEVRYDLNNRIKAMQDSAVAVERDSIAQNIHDGIAQELFFMSVQLFQLKGAIQRNSGDEAMTILSEMEKKVKESHRDIRKFIVELKGEKRRFNLQDAIETMLHRITDHTGVKLLFENIGWIPQEKIEVEETIFHLIEEAANNVIKHAKANLLHVKLEVTSVQWTILIIDDGDGMKEIGEAAQGDKFGIIGMTNRIKALNGSIFFHSDDSLGTTVMATIPRERSLAYV